MVIKTILISAAFVVVLPLIAVSQTVTSGFIPLAEDVYAFTAEGCDDGFVAGCELGNDVRIYTSKNFTDIEEYSAIEQLKLLGSEDTPSLVAAGFGTNKTPTALLLGISKNPESWPVFHQLIFGKDKISLVSYPTNLVAGVFNEPGAWAELCPFFSRQETLTGFSGLYQTSYLYARPDGSFAGVLWRDNGVWLVTFADAKVVVDRIYAPKGGNILAPVWSVSCTKAGKIAAVVTEIASAQVEENEVTETPAITEPEIESATPEPASSDLVHPDESGDTSESSVAPNTTETVELEGEVESETVTDENTENVEPESPSEDPPPAENAGEETPPAEEGTSTDDSEMPESGEVAETPATTEAPAPIPEVKAEAKLVLVSNYNSKTWAVDVAETKQPQSVALGLAVDGRPIVFWIIVDKDKGKLAYYWGLKHTDVNKIVPFTLAPSPKSAPPFATIRTIGLPVLVHEEAGKVLLRLNNGSSPEWINQEAYTLTGRLMGLDAVMGLKTTAYFVLDGDKLMWHWHKSK